MKIKFDAYDNLLLNKPLNFHMLAIIVCYFNNGFKSDSKICNDCDWGIKYFGGFGIIHVNGVGLQIFYVRYD